MCHGYACWDGCSSIQQQSQQLHHLHLGSAGNSNQLVCQVRAGTRVAPAAVATVLVNEPEPPPHLPKRAMKSADTPEKRPTYETCARHPRHQLKHMFYKHLQKCGTRSHGTQPAARLTATLLPSWFSNEVCTAAAPGHVPFPRSFQLPRTACVVLYGPAS